MAVKKSGSGTRGTGRRRPRTTATSSRTVRSRGAAVRVARKDTAPIESQLPSVKKEIIINAAEHETRIAVLEDSRLVEILYERPDSQPLSGRIYKGIVTSVFPGMQAAFVDIGEKRTAFLHVSDIGRHLDETTHLDEEDDGKRPTKRRVRAKIEDQVTKGQEMLVQVIKEPMGTKGARVSSEVSLPGRFVVLVPEDNHLRVSKRITSWAEKRRLRQALAPLRPEGCGLIARTECEGKSERDVVADVKRLTKDWKKIKKLVGKEKAPALVHQELNVMGALVRDVFSDDVERLVIDDKSAYKAVISYLKPVAPELRQRVERYDGDVPIFDLYGIESELEKTFERRVWFKRGSFLVIDQTEAMVTIDVNTGRYVGKKSQEETILNANMEAAREVARQIRLRDIGGLIVIDFIDMMHHADRVKVFEKFVEEFRRDRAKNSIAPISEFGLIEMTRQRLRPSFLQAVSSPCPTCEGMGRILSIESVFSQIERWFSRARIASDIKDFELVVPPAVYEFLSESRERRLKHIRKTANGKIHLIADELLPPNKYRIVSRVDDVDVTDLFRPQKVK